MLDAETLREGLFAMHTRRFGAVAEIMIARMAKLDRGRSKFHDLYDGLANQRVEVKFSRALRRHARVIDEDSVLLCIEEAKSLERMIHWDDRTKVAFDCNIQQIDRKKFEMLYYGIFFFDTIAIFRIATEDIGSQIAYSNIQHSLGEGQFHIKTTNIEFHEANYLYQRITYQELFDLLTD